LESALVQPSWSGHSIGSAGFWEDANGRRFADGLTDDEFGGVVTEFFVQARHHYQLDEPSIEIALPFLWFFDAVPDGEGWSSLDRDGHLQPLVRVERPTIGSYRVQCAAGQLRRYLRAADRVLLTQHDVRRFRSLSRILRHERATCSV
jgi:hypothetical protein